MGMIFNRLLFVLVFMFPIFAFGDKIASNALVINACSMATATCASNTIDASKLTNLSFHAVWTGTAENGTFKLQVSNDTAATVTTWTDVSGSSQTISADGDFAWNVSNTGYKYIRLLYTKASGTGTLSATFMGKGSI